MPSLLGRTPIYRSGVYRTRRCAQYFCCLHARTGGELVLTLSAPKFSGADEANQEVIYGNLPGTQRIVKHLAIRFLVHFALRCPSSCDDYRDTTLRSGE